MVQCGHRGQSTDDLLAHDPRGGRAVHAPQRPVESPTRVGLGKGGRRLYSTHRCSAFSASMDVNNGDSSGIIMPASTKSCALSSWSRISMHGMPSTIPIIMQARAQISKGVPYSAPVNVAAVCKLYLTLSVSFCRRSGLFVPYRERGVMRERVLACRNTSPTTMRPLAKAKPETNTAAGKLRTQRGMGSFVRLTRVQRSVPRHDGSDDLSCTSGGLMYL